MLVFKGQMEIDILSPMLHYSAATSGTSLLVVMMPATAYEEVGPAEVTAVLARLTPDQRRRLGAELHMDDRTLRRCAAGQALKSSSIARIVEGLQKLGLLTAL